MRFDSREGREAEDTFHKNTRSEGSPVPICGNTETSNANKRCELCHCTNVIYLDEFCVSFVY